MTVQTLRSPGASDILVNTVTGVPTYFYGSMGAPHTFTDPVTNETITIISEATAVDFAGHIDTGKIVIDAIAPGYVDTRGSLVGDIVVVRPVTEWANNIFNVMNQSLNDNGSLKDSAIVYNPNVADHIASGGIWTTLTGLNASMTALVAYQAGLRGAISAVATRAFTLSKDTYVDVLRTTAGYTTSYSLVYTEVANGAAAPALAANSIRIAKVVTGASAITSIDQANPDSLGNLLYPQNINGKRVTHLRYESNGVNPWANGNVVPYAGKIFDHKNEWNASTYRLTITEPGLYDIMARTWWGSAGAGTTEVCELFIRKNGVNYTTSDRMNGSGDANRLLRPYVRSSLYLNIGDYVDVILGSSNLARDLVGGSNSFIEIHRIA